MKVLKILEKHDLTTVRKSNFLTQTLNRISEIKWVDMEVDYFDQLLACKQGEKFDFDMVEKLNNEFDFLKTKLEAYLLNQQSLDDAPYSEYYKKIFCKEFNPIEIVTKVARFELPNNILLLSFNYTNTLEKYREECSNAVSTQINYIHGQLGSERNPIIFGFGDEYNKTYLEFEDLRNKALLKHIKSFDYFRTSNYHHLIRFIEEDDFQVFVMGHSLGLSDRTMLKQIFEHEKCKSIKIFYYQKDENHNDYTEKTFDISSHFTDKAMMRKKIVPYDSSIPMPEID
jgi:hypothetical protein